MPEFSFHVNHSTIKITSTNPEATFADVLSQYCAEVQKLNGLREGTLTLSRIVSFRVSVHHGFLPSNFNPPLSLDMRLRDTFAAEGGEIAVDVEEPSLKHFLTASAVSIQSKNKKKKKKNAQGQNAIGDDSATNTLEESVGVTDHDSNVASDDQVQSSSDNGILRMLQEMQRGLGALKAELEDERKERKTERREMEAKSEAERRAQDAEWEAKSEAERKALKAEWKAKSEAGRKALKAEWKAKSEAERKALKAELEHERKERKTERREMEAKSEAERRAQDAEWEAKSEAERKALKAEWEKSEVERKALKAEWKKSEVERKALKAELQALAAELANERKERKEMETKAEEERKKTAADMEILHEEVDDVKETVDDVKETLDDTANWIVAGCPPDSEILYNLKLRILLDRVQARLAFFVGLADYDYERSSSKAWRRSLQGPTTSHRAADARRRLQGILPNQSESVKAALNNLIASKDAMNMVVEIKSDIRTHGDRVAHHELTKPQYVAVVDEYCLQHKKPHRKDSLTRFIEVLFP